MSILEKSTPSTNTVRTPCRHRWLRNHNALPKSGGGALTLALLVASCSSGNVDTQDDRASSVASAAMSCSPRAVVSASVAGEGTRTYQFNCSAFPATATQTNTRHGTLLGLQPQSCAGSTTVACARGSYKYFGYVEVALVQSDVAGKLLSLDATRPNYVNYGDFASSDAMGTSAEQDSKWYKNGDASGLTTDGKADLAVQSDGTTTDIMQSFPVGLGETYTVNFDFDGSGLESEEPYPNGKFQSMHTRLRYQNIDRVDPDRVATRTPVYNLWMFYPTNDAGGDLISGSPQVITGLRSYKKSDLTGKKSFKLHVPDGLDHEVHPTLTAAGVQFNPCGRSGTGNTSATDSAVGCTNLTHASLEFYADAQTTDSTGRVLAGRATVDNVVVDLDKSVEIEVLDSGHNSLARSSLDKGMYVDPSIFGATSSATDKTYVRVYMRSYLADKYPTVKTLTISDGFDVEVTKGTETASITSERMSQGASWDPPMSDVKDTTLENLRSKCGDSKASKFVNCYQYFVNKDIPIRKYAAFISWLKATWNKSTRDYDLSLTTDADLGVGSENGEFYVKSRIANSIARYGLKGTLLLLDSDSIYDPTAVNASGGLGKQVYLNDLSTHGKWASGAELAKHIVAKYAAFFANHFDGSRSTRPQFDAYELFGEVNGAAAGAVTWGSPSREELATLTNDVASAIHAVRPKAVVTTPGIHGGYNSADWVIDAPFLSAVGSAAATGSWDATRFDALAFHPYISGRAPEELGQRWSDGIAALAASSPAWSATLTSATRKPAYLTEWGATHETYNPSCVVSKTCTTDADCPTSVCNIQPYHCNSPMENTVCSTNADCPGTTCKMEYLCKAPVESASSGQYNGRWSRGLGVVAHGKLIARNTLENLQLPVDQIHPYGTFTPESQGIGLSSCGKTSTDPCYTCWQSDPGYNFHFFDRVPGTGALRTKDGKLAASTYDGQLGTWPSSPLGVQADASTVSYFIPNDAGRAYTIIAQYLATASPYSSTISVTEANGKSDTEHYYSALFKSASDEYVLALWEFKDYLYGADWMDYLSGAKEDGFTEQRIHRVKLSNFGYPLMLGGVSNVVSATVVGLDGSAENALQLDTSTGSPILKGVVFGERPVLVRLKIGPSTL